MQEAKMQRKWKKYKTKKKEFIMNINFELTGSAFLF